MIMVFSLMIYFAPSSYFVRYLIFEGEEKLFHTEEQMQNRAIMLRFNSG